VLQLNDAFLSAVGLGGLPSGLRRLALETAYDLLEVRVGEALTSRMTDDQMADFESLIDEGLDDVVSLDWLQDNLPDYKLVVHSEFENLKSEIDKDSEFILASIAELLGD